MGLHLPQVNTHITVAGQDRQGRAGRSRRGGWWCQAVKDRLTVQRGNLTYSGGAKYLMRLVPVDGSEGDGEGGSRACELGAVCQPRGFLGRVRAGCLHKLSSASRDRQTDVDTSTGEIINARPRPQPTDGRRSRDKSGAQHQHPWISGACGSTPFSTGPSWELPSCQTSRTLSQPPTHTRVGHGCASLSRNLGTLNRWAREAWETSNAGLAAFNCHSGTTA